MYILSVNMIYSLFISAHTIYMLWKKMFPVSRQKKSDIRKGNGLVTLLNSKTNICLVPRTNIAYLAMVIMHINVMHINVHDHDCIEKWKIFVSGLLN